MKKLLLLAVIGLTAGSVFAGNKMFHNAAGAVKLHIRLTDNKGDKFYADVQQGGSKEIHYPTVDAKEIKVEALKFDGARAWDLYLAQGQDNDALNSHREFKIVAGNQGPRIVPSRR